MATKEYNDVYFANEVNRQIKSLTTMKNQYLKLGRPDKAREYEKRILELKADKLEQEVARLRELARSY